MESRIVMPKLGLTMSEGVLSKWLVAEGQRVKAGDPLFEVETDKIVMEVVAEAEGFLHVVVPAGSTVHVLDLIGYVANP